MILRHQSTASLGMTNHSSTPPSEASNPNGTSSYRPLSMAVRARLAVADGVVDSPGHKALRGHHVELRQPPMFDCSGGLDDLLGPRDRLVLFHQ